MELSTSLQLSKNTMMLVLTGLLQDSNLGRFEHPWLWEKQKDQILLLACYKEQVDLKTHAWGIFENVFTIDNRLRPTKMQNRKFILGSVKFREQAYKTRTLNVRKKLE